MEINSFKKKINYFVYIHILSIIYRKESIINLDRVEIRKHRHRSESLIPWTKSNIKSTQKKVNIIFCSYNMMDTFVYFL